MFIFKKSISFCQTDELSAERRRILDDLIYECARLLRNSCAIGRDVIQNHILNVFDVSELFEAIRAILESKAFSPSKKTLKMCWQFVANLAVQNVDGSHHFWRYCGGFVCGPNRHWQCPCESGNAREITMILYNAFRGGNGNCKVFIEFLLGCYDSSSIIQHETNNEFHQIFMEYFITKYPLIVSIGYLKLDISKQLHLLYYIADYMRAPSHATISNYLLEGICFQFKMKSDCILKTISSYVDAIEPKEVVALLDILAQASSDERYTHILANDGSLFLNVGCLLQTITKIGKRPSGEDDNNIFTPVQKLGQLAPNSEENTNIERDISYSLKSMLIRVIGNLSYKNIKNQALAREMGIIMAVVDSTCLDARNPCRFYHFIDIFRATVSSNILFSFSQ